MAERTRVPPFDPTVTCSCCGEDYKPRVDGVECACEQDSCNTEHIRGSRILTGRRPMGEFTTCNRCDVNALQRHYGAENVHLEPDERTTWSDAVRATHTETGEFLAWFGSIPEECCCG